MKLFHFLSGFTLVSIIFIGCSSTKKNAPAFSEVAAGVNAEWSNKMGIAVPTTANAGLVEAVINWIGTPYKYGGIAKDGVDCSGFISLIYKQVFQYQLPRTTTEMHNTASSVPTKALVEGDLVFFAIIGSKPNHAGIYLWNGYFAHSSTTKGVMISSLSEAYWSKYFIGAGRFQLAKP